jgi:hypothetical protein
MTHALLSEQRKGGVIVYVTTSAVIAQHSAMPVIGVFAKAFIRDEQYVRVSLSQGAQGLLDYAIIVHGAGTDCVFLFGNAEEDERLEAQLHRFADFVHQAIDTELMVARHRRNFFLNPATRTDKQRQDEIVYRESRFANQISHQGMVAEPAHPDSWKTGAPGASRLCVWLGIRSGRLIYWAFNHLIGSVHD